MNLKEYSGYVKSTARIDPTYIANLFLDKYPLVDGSATVADVRGEELLAAIGLAGEAGEFLEHYKKWLFHKKSLDYTALIAEAGDLLWYFTLWLNATGIPIEHVIDANVAKLDERREKKQRQFASDAA